ncbi:FAD/NAD(P)-binding domain-containing protein [Atractiella rhizophila]|nr:FAD/NAD(P)-binding domain-containing protein [Atractiella rhizophila]
MSYPREVDFIIVGGGACGITLLARLARSNPSNTFLVVERGQVIVNDPTPTSFKAKWRADLCLLLKASPSLDILSDRYMLAVGCALSGSSMINWTMYSKPSKSEFDGWKQQGWNFDEVLPFLNKVEDYQCPMEDASKHGNGGNLKVTPTKIGPYTEEWLDVLAKSGVPHKVE